MSLLVGTEPARSVVSQIDGTIVPIDPPELQNAINPYETTPIDAINDAFTFPQIFLPPPYGSGLTVTFRDVQEQAGFENSFGWYNVGDTSRLFRIFSCYPTDNEPPDTVTVDFTSEFDLGHWDGGFIAFYIITPEGRPSGYNNCGDFDPAWITAQHAWFGHIYFTESEQNGDGDYVHNLVYSSHDDPNRFYFAFEDLFRGGDNDFTDFTIQVEGLTPPCTPQSEVCDGADNDCDGEVDEDDSQNPAVPLTQACYTGPGGTEDVGLCHGGTQTCSGGSYGACVGEVTPVPEVCDGEDNDCNGTVDDNLTDVGAVCGTGVGECSTGTTVCTSGVLECSGEVGPAPEVCDSKDNDCDNAVDEGLGTTTCGLGVCNHTIDNCSGGVSQTCDPLQGAGSEVCDGVDNDCDGIADGLQQACYPAATQGCSEVPPGSGTWVCDGTCSAGIQDCPAGGAGTWGTCRFAITPVGEVCDNADNDCNGTVDDGLVQTCYPLGYGPSTGCSSPTSCTGACQVGARTCAAGAWGACAGAVTPSAETCNNVDDDCDGAVDGITEVCQRQNGFGTCSGTRVCTLGAWGVCSAQVPAAESCNNVDDDCDGAIDEGVSQACYSGGAGTQGVGACHGGTQVCVAGSFGACEGEVTPTGEVCDGVDNDCDGVTDEDGTGSPLQEVCYSGPPGTAGTGVCQSGTRTCAASGSWGPCQGEVVPSAEQCNGLDDDCDGDVDEDLGQITCGLGQCLHSVPACVGGAPQSCDPYAGSQPEVCDGLDNDCDGVADGLVQTCFDYPTGCAETPPGSGTFTCAGVCSPGVQVCAVGGGGSWGACLGQVGPAEEVCDGLDNDCDGDVDESEDGSPLHQACYPPGSGRTTGCVETSPGEWDCLGTCRVGERTCQGAAWTGCVGDVTPTVEVCDGTDNDCDGEIDEPEDIPGLNQPCSTALGRCTPGILRCVDGQEECEGGAGPFPGECNGQDDDCDGEIDEQDEVAAVEGLPCGDATGLCEPGISQCVGGQIQCVGGVQPGEEVCDGEDNDCDGQVDNDAECPPDFFCVQGDCRTTCDPTQEFSCPGTLKCQSVDVGGGEQEYICLPDQGECGGETCPDGWVCQSDHCVDPCDPDPCESWQECHGGGCVDVSCTAPGRGCPAGQFCQDHECVGDPCESADCDPTGFYCRRTCDGQGCEATCEPLCACDGDERCDAAGQCEPDPCYGVECEAAERCGATGQCEPDPCHGVVCGFGEACFEGSCFEDPCDQVACPEFYRCAIHADGVGAPEATCRPDDAFWIPGQPGDAYLGTGGGGCQCRAAPGGGVPPLGMLLLLMVLPWWWRRRRSAAKGVRP